MRYGERLEWKLLRAWAVAGGFEPSLVDRYRDYYEHGTSSLPGDASCDGVLPALVTMLRVPDTDNLGNVMLAEAARHSWGNRGGRFFESTCCVITTNIGMSTPLLRGASRELWSAALRGDLVGQGVHVERKGLGVVDFLTASKMNPDIVSWLDAFQLQAEQYEAVKNTPSGRHHYRLIDKMLSEARKLRADGEPYRWGVQWWRLGRMIPPRRDVGVGDVFEDVWQHLSAEYVRWIPALHESERIWYEWSQERSAREQWARMRLDLRKEGPQFTSFEGLGPRVCVATSRIDPNEHSAAVIRRMDGYGFLRGQEPLVARRSDGLLTKEWIEEVGFPAESTVLQLETSADFIDSDIAKIDLTVVYGTNKKGKSLVVWLPRPHAEYDYGQSARDFDLNLRMVHRELDAEFATVTASPMIPREHRGSVVDMFEFHKYRNNPSPFGCGAYLPT